jgi:hypothetical protein
MNAFVSLPEETKKLAMDEMVLVKVKIMKAEYFDTKTGKVSWWQNAFNSFTTWFRNSNNYRPDIFYPAS